MRIEPGGVPARSRRPPRWLILVTGLVLLVFVGSIAVIVIFQSVLLPGQQQRVMAILPFMDTFLIRRRVPGDVLPTALPRTPGSISPVDLLSGSLPPVTPLSELPITATPFATQVQ